MNVLEGSSVDYFFVLKFRGFPWKRAPRKQIISSPEKSPLPNPINLNNIPQNISRVSPITPIHQLKIPKAFEQSNTQI
jgi:hypothetical protein